MINVWDVEAHPGYLEWLAGVQACHPRHTDAPGSSVVGCTLVAAERREGALHLGVLLSSGDEFWTPWPGTLDELVAQEAERGTVFSSCGMILRAASLVPAFEAAHGGVARLEFCSSHVGGFTRAVAADGAAMMLDED